MVKFELRFSLEVEFKLLVLPLGISRHGTTDLPERSDFFSAFLKKKNQKQHCFFYICPWFPLISQDPQQYKFSSDNLPPDTYTDDILGPDQMRTAHTNQYSPYLQ